MERKIIHIDMDAFFASVEQRDFPELQGKAIAVGGNKERGVIAAASYEARKYGIKSAMSSKIAHQKYPQLIFKPPRFEVYKEVSQQIQAIFKEYTDLVEPLSLDEAYLDVTENKKGIPSATKIANEIRKRIWEECRLTASAGISSTKFVAKIASDINKPNGFCVIKPNQVNAFLLALPISKFQGIGKVTAKKLNEFGIYFGSDLKKQQLSFLSQHFGKSGAYFYNIIRGIDNRAVNPDRVRKSVGAETTFEFDLSIQDLPELEEKMTQLCGRVWNRLQRINKAGRTLTVKIKSNDFNTITRSITLQDGTYNGAQKITQAAFQLLKENLLNDQKIRLIGISISNFSVQEKPKNNVQLTLDF